MRLLIASLFVLAGCTDADWDAAVGKLGVAADIRCYSGGQLVFQDTSTGAVSSPREGSDGWQYRSAVGGKFVEVSADCVLIYKE